MLTPNRLSVAIDKTRAAISEKDAETMAALEDTLAITLDEHFRFQQLQSRAHAEGTLSTDEAQVVYIALGENMASGNGGWAARTDLATKVVVTNLMGELLERRLAEARA